MLEGAHDVMNSAPCMAWAVRVGVKCKEKVRVPAFHRVSLFYSTVARRLAAAAPDFSVSEYFGDPKELTTLLLNIYTFLSLLVYVSYVLPSMEKVSKIESVESGDSRVA